MTRAKRRGAGATNSEAAGAVLLGLDDLSAPAVAIGTLEVTHRTTVIFTGECEVLSARLEMSPSRFLVHLVNLRCLSRQLGYLIIYIPNIKNSVS